MEKNGSDGYEIELTPKGLIITEKLREIDEIFTKRNHKIEKIFPDHND